jgi:hypothetical protein
MMFAPAHPTVDRRRPQRHAAVPASHKITPSEPRTSMPNAVAKTRAAASSVRSILARTCRVSAMASASPRWINPVVHHCVAAAAAGKSSGTSVA